MPKLSIVVPVWNTLPEKLDKCLKSMFSQKDVDFRQVEVLVVDSSDADAQQEVANSYPCKIVRSKTRLMLGVARNAGHKYSAGEYLWFVDADDWISEGCLSKILRRLDGKTDIFFAPFKKLSTGKTLFCKPTTPEEFAVLPVAAWNKVYKREHYA